MRRAKVETVEDLFSLPEGERFEVPEGLRLSVTYEGTVRVERRRVTVDLPRGALEGFRDKGRKDLSVRLSRNKLVIERRASRPARRTRKAA